MYTIQNSVRVNTHRDGCLGKLLDPCRFSKLDYRTRRSLNLCLCFLTPVRIQTDTSSCKQGDARVIVTWAGWESKKAPGNTKAKNKTNWGGGGRAVLNGYQMQKTMITIWILNGKCSTYFVRFSFGVVSCVAAQRTAFCSIVRKVNMSVTTCAAVKSETFCAGNGFHFAVGLAKVLWRIDPQISSKSFYDVFTGRITTTSSLL